MATPDTTTHSPDRPEASPVGAIRAELDRYERGLADHGTDIADRAARLQEEMKRLREEAEQFESDQAEVRPVIERLRAIPESSQAAVLRAAQEIGDTHPSTLEHVYEEAKLIQRQAFKNQAVKDAETGFTGVKISPSYRQDRKDWIENRTTLLANEAGEPTEQQISSVVPRAQEEIASQKEVFTSYGSKRDKQGSSQISEDSVEALTYEDYIAAKRAKEAAASEPAAAAPVVDTPPGNPTGPVELSAVPQATFAAPDSEPAGQPENPVIAKLKEAGYPWEKTVGSAEESRRLIALNDALEGADPRDASAAMRELEAAASAAGQDQLRADLAGNPEDPYVRMGFIKTEDDPISVVASPDEGRRAAEQRQREGDLRSLAVDVPEFDPVSPARSRITEVVERDSGYRHASRSAVRQPMSVEEAIDQDRRARGLGPRPARPARLVQDRYPQPGDLDYLEPPTPDKPVKPAPGSRYAPRASEGGAPAKEFVGRWGRVERFSAKHGFKRLGKMARDRQNRLIERYNRKGDELVKQANYEGDHFVEGLNRDGDQMIRDANYKGDQMVTEANGKGDTIVAEANGRGDTLVRRANGNGSLDAEEKRRLIESANRGRQRTPWGLKSDRMPRRRSSSRS